MSWYGDPDELDRLATRLSAAADRVRDRGRAVRASATQARWQGPAADAFHAALGHETQRLDRAAGELDDAAAALHRHAAAVRAEIARLRALERATVGAVAHGLSRLERLVS